MGHPHKLHLKKGKPGDLVILNDCNRLVAVDPSTITTHISGPTSYIPIFTGDGLTFDNNLYIDNKNEC